MLFAITDKSNKFKNDQFDCYYLFRNIVDLGLIIFKKAFPSETITFKMHHVLHYSILLFDNLTLCRTLRYERVHQKVNRSLEGSRNRKNLPKSIAKQYTFSPEAAPNSRLVGFTSERDNSKNVLKNFHIPFKFSKIYLKLPTDQELESDDLKKKYEIESEESENEEIKILIAF